MSALSRQSIPVLLGVQGPILRTAGSKRLCFACAGRVVRRSSTSSNAVSRQVVRTPQRTFVRALSGGVPREKDRRRGYAGAATRVQVVEDAAEDVQDETIATRSHEIDVDGPAEYYEAQVQRGALKSDDYQRGIVQTLQTLHDELKLYKSPNVVHPTIESLTPEPKGFFASLFGGAKKAEITAMPDNVPRGLYLYGDVGCGKTMLMDLFYKTLPSNVESKLRIHFNNFMQNVHKRLHRLKVEHGADFDAIPFVAAEIADEGKVLCFDEFQCTDVADAMILRRLLESLFSHGVVMVITSNRHPDQLYLNGIQRQSFIPCIELIKKQLRVIPLDSPTDYRKVPRPSAGVYHHPLDKNAVAHANKWFEYLGDPNDPPHPETQTVWGRHVKIPLASGKAARFSFMDICGSPLSAADYLELCKWYNAFIITDVPQMNHRQRDLARRFITFIDAVYESRARIVLTSEVPLPQLFISREDLASSGASDVELDDAMRMMMDDLKLSAEAIKNSSIFSGDEERFAFARALSRLSEMGGEQWGQ